jgi:hypothetical protein
VDIILYAREGYTDHSVELRKAVYGRDILLRLRPKDQGSGAYDVQLYPASYFDKPTVGGGPVFPTQYAGLRYYHGTVKELCLVDVADAPLPVWRVRKGATTYAVYLVDTTDPNASTVRIRTASGTKAARLKT